MSQYPTPEIENNNNKKRNEDIIKAIHIQIRRT